MSNLSITNGNVGSIALSSMDLETAMAMIQGTRANLLEGQLKDQLSSVQQKNEQIAELNSHLDQQRTELGQLESQLSNLQGQEEGLQTALSNMNALLTKCTNPGQYIGLSNVWGGDDVEKSKQMEQMLQDLGIDTSKVINSDGNQTRDASRETIQQFVKELQVKLDNLQDVKRDISAIKTNIDNTKTQIDGLSNSQQMEMLRLQSLSNKRNEAFDVMSNFIKKMQDNRSSIVSNMR